MRSAPLALRHAHSVPPAAKRAKIPERPRSHSAPARLFNPEQFFRGARRERGARWTPTFADKPSAGSYDLQDAP